MIFTDEEYRSLNYANANNAENYASRSGKDIVQKDYHIRFWTVLLVYSFSENLRTSLVIQLQRLHTHIRT